jgi:hypothetical protein
VYRFVTEAKNRLLLAADKGKQNYELGKKWGNYYVLPR